MFLIYAYVYHLACLMQNNSNNLSLFTFSPFKLLADILMIYLQSLSFICPNHGSLGAFM